VAALVNSGEESQINAGDARRQSRFDSAFTASGLHGRRVLPFDHSLLNLRNPIRPSRPPPRRSMVEGSGTGATFI
jgi:hypothetical protein